VPESPQFPEGSETWATIKGVVVRGKGTSRGAGSSAINRGKGPRCATEGRFPRGRKRVVARGG
jgi:hypothetical protein